MWLGVEAHLRCSDLLTGDLSPQGSVEHCVLVRFILRNAGRKLRCTARGPQHGIRSVVQTETIVMQCTFVSCWLS